MTILEYLQSENNPIKLSWIAGKMWEGDKNARQYLNGKIKGVRPWTKEDDEKAMVALKELGDDLKKIKSSY